MRKWEMEIFTLSGCVYCEELERGLKLYNIPYNDTDITYAELLGNILEKTYQCDSYPMIVLKEPISKIWLPNTSLLPSNHIEVYSSIPQLLEKINKIHKSNI
jgi:glutaredoxin